MPQRLLHVPHISQHAEADCLAACAAMVLTYVGIQPNYARLLSELGITAYGTPLSRIARLAEHYPGLKIERRKGDLTHLRIALDEGVPPVVFLDTAELAYHRHQAAGHAMVLVGYDQAHFLVNDPAFDRAPQTIHEDEFYLAWLAFDTVFVLVRAAH